jgi:hypothetical protein
MYQQPLIDQDLQCIWEALTLLTGSTRLASPAAHDIRASIARAHEQLGPIVTQMHEQAFIATAASILPALEQATRRERAIVETLTERRARLSAALLQPGLFDRRNERAAASQAAVIDEALARCRQRLHELDRRAHISTEPIALRFALFRR